MWPPQIIPLCQYVVPRLPPSATRTRGVLCVSGGREPQATERHALHSKDSGDGRSTRPRSRVHRKAGDPAEGKPEESRSRAEGRGGTTQGAQGPREWEPRASIPEGTEGFPCVWGYP
jgi:hypothetical protein